MLRLAIDFGICSHTMKVIPLLLVAQIKSSKQWIHSNAEFKKTPLTCRVDSIGGCNVGDKGDDDNTANTVSSSINMDNLETESTGTVSSIVRACDADVSHQNITGDLEFSQNP